MIRSSSSSDTDEVSSFVPENEAPVAIHRENSRSRRVSRNLTELNYNGSNINTGPKGRRASVATEKVIDIPQTNAGIRTKRYRSPRASIVPDIENDIEGDLTVKNMASRDIVLLEMTNRSPRNSLASDDYYRSSRNSRVPDVIRSPRNSIVPEMPWSPRHSLTTEIVHSPHYSPVPDSSQISPRNSVVQEIGTYNRTPRNSLTPQAATRSLLITENGMIINRSPRNSLVPPEPSRSPQGSVTNLGLIDRSPRLIEMDRTSRGSIVSEYLNPSRRGSVVPESSRSLRGSIDLHEQINRSSRSSNGINIDRRSRSSIGQNEDDIRRNDIESEIINRTPRSSLGGFQEKKGMREIATFQDPRRSSADQGSRRNRCSSPYHQGDNNFENIKTTSMTSQKHLGFGNVYEDSRRESTSVSQHSADESRQLVPSAIKIHEKRIETTQLHAIPHGAFVFQLVDAKLEANGACDFLFRTLKIICKTNFATVCLFCLGAIPFLMLIMGLQFFRKCPLERHIPVYMIVGGIFGTLEVFLTVYCRIRSRKPETLTVLQPRPQVSPMMLVFMLAILLAIWYAFGSYWIFRIMWPNYHETLYAPDSWCSKPLYIFAVIHVIAIYVVLGALLLVLIGLLLFRLF